MLEPPPITPIITGIPSWNRNKKWNQLDEQTTYKQERCYRKVVKRYTAENNGRHQSSKKQKTNKLTFIVLTLQIGAIKAIQLLL
jgi:hypothetical protein